MSLFTGIVDHLLHVLTTGITIDLAQHVIRLLRAVLSKNIVNEDITVCVFCHLRVGFTLTLLAGCLEFPSHDSCWSTVLGF